MYLPAQFEETRVEVLHDLMREHPFATLVAHGDDGLSANHLPLHLAAGVSIALLFFAVWDCVAVLYRHLSGAGRRKPNWQR